MTTSAGPGGTRAMDGSLHGHNARLRAAQREIDRLTRWITIAVLAFGLAFVLAALLWWTG